MERAVFVDGSCFNNGKKNSSGGIGVFFGDGDPRNAACRIVEGKVTNQTMELRACWKAMETINRTRRQDETFVIYTDSMYALNCMTSWAKTWKRKGWKTKDGHPVSNLGLIKPMHEVFEASPWIRLEYTRAHGPQPESRTSREYRLWYGNDRAHRLATAGAKAPAATCIEKYFDIRISRS
jgi:ribonuclease HI